MLQKLYEAIREDAAPVELTINERPYTDKPIYPVKTPEPQPLTVSTLTSLADYLNANVDKLVIPELICHVVSPSTVAIRSKLLGEFCNRACYVYAELNQVKLPFNSWLDAESFNIALQACFAEPVAGAKATDKGLVLKFVSSVTSIVEAALSDDGVSQAVAVKTGITSKDVKELPNPVNLRPFRTFTEIEQPESAFIFRCRQDQGKMQFMLCEADGGAWRSEAMKNIQKFMQEHVKDLHVIA